MKVLETYDAGAPVPEWLISVDPGGGDAQLGLIVFDCDVAVLECDDESLLVVPRAPAAKPSESMILLDDCYNLEIRATSRSVSLPERIVTLHRSDGKMGSEFRLA